MPKVVPDNMNHVLGLVSSITREELHSCKTADDLKRLCEQVENAISRNPKFEKVLEDLTDSTGPNAKDAKRACEHRQFGNDNFKLAKFEKAIEHYTKALQYLPFNSEQGENAARIYSNRAACLLKLGATEPAIRDCTRAINHDKGYSKAWFRRGCALASDGQWKAAKSELQTALYLEEKSMSPTGVQQVTNELAKLAVKLQGTPESSDVNRVGKGKGDGEAEGEGDHMIGRVIEANTRTVSEKCAQGEEVDGCSNGEKESFIKVTRGAEIVWTADKGRGLIATKGLQAGEVFLSEMPYAAILHKSLRSQRCHFCFQRLPLDPIPCFGCYSPLYCGEVCRKSAFSGDWNTVFSQNLKKKERREKSDEVWEGRMSPHGINEMRSLFENEFEKGLWKREKNCSANGSGLKGSGLNRTEYLGGSREGWGEHRHECGGVGWAVVLPERAAMAARLTLRQILEETVEEEKKEEEEKEGKDKEEQEGKEEEEECKEEEKGKGQEKEKEKGKGQEKEKEKEKGMEKGMEKGKEEGKEKEKEKRPITDVDEAAKLWFDQCCGKKGGSSSKMEERLGGARASVQSLQEHMELIPDEVKLELISLAMVVSSCLKTAMVRQFEFLNRRKVGKGGECEKENWGKMDLMADKKDKTSVDKEDEINVHFLRQAKRGILNKITGWRLFWAFSVLRNNSMAVKEPPFSEDIGNQIRVTVGAEKLRPTEIVPAMESHKEESIGIALYSTASFLNHSCSPNSFASFKNRAIFVRNVQKVPPGIALEISYGPQKGEETAAERRKKLFENWGFYCKCFSCENTREIDLSLWGYRCSSPKCLGVVLGPNTIEEDLGYFSEEKTGDFFGKLQLLRNKKSDTVEIQGDSEVKREGREDNCQIEKDKGQKDKSKDKKDKGKGQKGEGYTNGEHSCNSFCKGEESVPVSELGFINRKKLINTDKSCNNTVLYVKKKANVGKCSSCQKEVNLTRVKLEEEEATFQLKEYLKKFLKGSCKTGYQKGKGREEDLQMGKGVEKECVHLLRSSLSRIATILHPFNRTLAQWNDKVAEALCEIRSYDLASTYLKTSIEILQHHHPLENVVFAYERAKLASVLLAAGREREGQMEKTAANELFLNHYGRPMALE